MQPANTITVGSVRAFVGSIFARRRCTDLCPCSHRRRHSHRHPECGPDHLLGAPGPADILLRFLDRNGEVVAARVVTCCGTGWTPGDPVPANLPPNLDVVHNLKLDTSRRVRPVTPSCWRLLLARNGIIGLADERPKPFF